MNMVIHLGHFATEQEQIDLHFGLVEAFWQEISTRVMIPRSSWYTS